MPIAPEMLAAKEALAASLSFVPGVVGVDIGLRIVDDVPTDEVVIRIFVTDEQAAPAEIEAMIPGLGWPVEILQRDFTPLADTGVYDPLVGGISIAAGHGPLGALQSGHGTLGGLARDTDSGTLLGLSCAHVIAHSPAGVAVGDPIVQPEGAVAASRRIGSLLRWSDDLDAALFALDPGVQGDPSVVDVGPVSGKAAVDVGSIVRKRGRTTLLTVGKVSGVHLTLFGSTLTDGFEIWSHDAVPPVFCDHGDSGSLIVNENDEAVGLLALAGLPIARLTTWGVPRPEFVSGFAVGILPICASLGIDF